MKVPAPLANFGKTLAKYAGIVTVMTTVFALGIVTGGRPQITGRISHIPQHVLDGYDHLPDGQYEIMSVAVVGKISYLTLHQNQEVFLKRMMTKTIVCEDGDGSTLKVSTVGNGRTVAVIKDVRPEVSPGPNYKQWLAGSVTQSAEKLAAEVASKVNQKCQMINVGMTEMPPGEIIEIPDPPGDLIPIEDEKPPTEKAISKK